jgi:PPE-repeat protein
VDDTACRAVARAGMVATTASLDDERPWPLLLVAGWLTTAADRVLAAGLEAELAAELAVSLGRFTAAEPAA